MTADAPRVTVEVDLPNAVLGVRWFSSAGSVPAVAGAIWQHECRAATGMLLENLFQTCDWLGKGFCPASIDGFCIGGREDGRCHG